MKATLPKKNAGKAAFCNRVANERIQAMLFSVKYIAWDFLNGRWDLGGIRQPSIMSSRKGEGN